MKIPAFLFPVLNPIMSLLLNSPLHFVLSGSILVIYFKGRRSGRSLSTPARYFIAADGTIVLVTETQTKWWPNFIDGAGAQVQLQGKRVAVHANSYAPPAAQVEERVVQMLDAHPADAAYMSVTKDTQASRTAGRPVWEQASLTTALANLVAVELTPAATIPTGRF